MVLVYNALYSPKNKTLKIVDPTYVASQKKSMKMDLASTNAIKMNK